MRKKILVVFLIFVILLLICGNIYLATTGKYLQTHIDDNTYINNVNVAQIEIEQLKNKVKEIEEEELKKEVVFKTADKEIVLTYNDLNSKSDLEEIVSNIKNNYSGNLLNRIKDYYSQKDLKKEYFLKIKVDEEKLREFVHNDFNFLETKGNVSYSLQDSSLVVEIEKRKVLDYEYVLGELNKGETTITIATKDDVPEIVVEELSEFLNKKAKNVNQQPKDATISFSGDELTVVEGYNGKTLNVEKTIDKAKNSIAKGENLLPLVFDETEPKVKAEELRKKMNNIKTKIGSMTTSFASSSSGRATNVTLAAKALDGVVVAPGEILSFYDKVGSATVAKGYQIATVFSGGKAVDGIGGGMCQVSSTLYNAALYANLEIVERHNHGLPVGYVKPSLDATVSSGVLDLKIKNTSGGYIYVRTTVANRNLTIDIYGEEKKYDVELTSNVLNYIEPTVEKTLNTNLTPGTEKVIEKGSRGYKSEAYRIVKQNGEVVKKEKLSTDTYRATKKEVQYNNSLPEETPTENIVVE